MKDPLGEDTFRDYMKSSMRENLEKFIWRRGIWKKLWTDLFQCLLWVFKAHPNFYFYDNSLFSIFLKWDPVVNFVIILVAPSYNPPFVFSFVLDESLVSC